MNEIPYPLWPAMGARRPVDRRGRVGRGDAVGVDGPVVGDLLAPLGGGVDLAAGHAGVGDVEDDRPCRPAGGGDRPRVGAHGLRSRPPQGAMAGLPLVVRMPDASLVRHPPRPVGGGAEVVAVAHGHDADAVTPWRAPTASCRPRSVTTCPTPSRPSRTATAPTSMTILGSVTARHRPGPQARGVPGKAEHAVGRVAPQVGGDQAVAHQSARRLGGTPSAVRTSAPNRRQPRRGPPWRSRGVPPAAVSSTWSVVSGRVGLAPQQQEQPRGLLQLLDRVGGGGEVGAGHDRAVVGQQERACARRPPPRPAARGRRRRGRGTAAGAGARPA